jgi:hypothetical protein
MNKYVLTMVVFAVVMGVSGAVHVARRPRERSGSTVMLEPDTGFDYQLYQLDSSLGYLGLVPRRVVSKTPQFPFFRPIALPDAQQTNSIRYDRRRVSAHKRPRQVKKLCYDADSSSPDSTGEQKIDSIKGRMPVRLQIPEVAQVFYNCERSTPVVVCMQSEMSSQ